MLKILPFLPTLCCLKKTGPLESSLIAIAVTNIIGEDKISRIKLNIISIVLFNTIVEVFNVTA